MRGSAAIGYRVLALVAALISASLLIGACDDAAEGICDPGDIDATPGGSTAFEAADIERAENADCLVVIYCDDVRSEAQRVGCLSHVVSRDVCERNTVARRAAVAAYIDATGDNTVCD